MKAPPGVYQGGVSFSKQLDLEGQAAVLDATTSPDGYAIEVSGPGGSGSAIEGWTVMKAQLAGILVGSHIVDSAGNPLVNGPPISNVTVDHVVVENNDTGFSGELGAGVGECFTMPFAPGDCGEGIHLVSVMNSTVEHSLVQNNAGGILMTDEFGPATDNTIAFDWPFERQRRLQHHDRGPHNEPDLQQRDRPQRRRPERRRGSAPEFTTTWSANNEASGSRLSTKP